MTQAMLDKGYTLATGGSDNHLVLWNVTPLKLSGGKVEAVLEKMHIYCNKNSIHGDKSPINPGGVRFGTPAMTTRGMVEEDMTVLVDYFEKAIDLALRVKEKAGPKLNEFIEALELEEFQDEIKGYQAEIKAYVRKFPVPISTID